MVCVAIPLKRMVLVPGVKLVLDEVQLPVKEWEKLPAEKLLVIEMLPVQLRLPVAVFTPVPLKVRLLKLLAPIFPELAPLKLIVDPVAIKVPGLDQFPPTVCVNAPAVKFPVIDTFPAMLSDPIAVFVPVPEKVMFSKLDAPIEAAVIPLKSIVEPAAEKVPEFVQFPPT